MVPCKGPPWLDEAYHFACAPSDGFREQIMKSRQSWAELYAIEVDRAAEEPVFRQIYLQLRSAILSGTLRPATRLPSNSQSCGSTRRFAVCRGFGFRTASRRGLRVRQTGAREPMSRPIFPSPSRQFMAGRSGRHRSRKTKACACLAISLMSRRRATSARSTWRARWWMHAPPNCGENSARASCGPLGGITLGYGDPHGMPELRNSVCDYLQAARAVRVRTRTGRDHGGHPASHRYCDPCHARSGQAGLGRGSRILLDPPCASRGGGQDLSDTGRPTWRQRQRGHPSRAKSARRFYNAIAPVSERRCPVDGAPPRASWLGARIRRVDCRGRLRQRIPVRRPATRFAPGP